MLSVYYLYADKVLSSSHNVSFFFKIIRMCHTCSFVYYFICMITGVRIMMDVYIRINRLIVVDLYRGN